MCFDASQTSFKVCDCFRHHNITHFLFKNNPSELSPMALCLVQPECWISILKTDSIFVKDFP